MSEDASIEYFNINGSGETWEAELTVKTSNLKIEIVLDHWTGDRKVDSDELLRETLEQSIRALQAAASQ